MWEGGRGGGWGDEVRDGDRRGGDRVGQRQTDVM